MIVILLRNLTIYNYVYYKDKLYKIKKKPVNEKISWVRKPVWPKSQCIQKREIFINRLRCGKTVYVVKQVFIITYLKFIQLSEL